MEKAGGSGSGGGGAGGVAAASSASCNSNSSAGQSQFGAFFGPPTPSNSQLLLLLQGRGKQTAGNHPPNPTLATPKVEQGRRRSKRKPFDLCFQRKLVARVPLLLASPERIMTRTNTWEYIYIYIYTYFIMV
ncbi:uncharacterized protein LOC127244942 isoform X2 [Andrographis paniculata]|uniref:uncharacterized protein LOC127244942 isoform X2 n=1 Tax=Andrographis paniculata TaxID=175694 RepID=UPI0021E87B2C|nr:uncharacterized protein LOC127244942 isoform X2 [Andrographis paniculata]